MIKKIKNSLVFKTCILTFLLLVLACGITYLFIARHMPYSFNTNASKNKGEETKALYESLENSQSKDVATLIADYAAATNTWVIIMDEAGNITATAGFNPDKLLAAAASWEDESTEYKKDQMVTYIEGQLPSDTISVYMSDSFRPKDQVAASYFYVFTSLEFVNEAVEAFKQVLPLCMVVIVLISLTGSVFYSWYIARPILRLNKISKDMCAFIFDQKAENNRTDEIGQLSRSMNQLSENLSAALARLEQANEKLQNEITYKTNFFTAVTHELKTPITIVKGQLEGMIHNIGVYRDRDRYLRKALDSVIRLEDLTKEILEAGRFGLENGQAEAREPVDLTQAVQEAVAAHRDMIGKKQLQLDWDIEEALFVKGNFSLLKKALDNILVNAIRYSPAGEKIRLQLKKEERKIIFSLWNGGVSLPEEDIGHLFEAFYRPGAARRREDGGTGLGLYLVKQILDLHDCDYGIGNGGNGVLFEIFWPLREEKQL